MARSLRADPRHALVTILVLVKCTLVCAQPDDYSHLVDLYATGDIQGAVSQLARWPRERVAAAVDAIAKTAERKPVWSGTPSGSPQLRDAAMLETDLAAARLEDEESVDFHLGLARRLIGLVGLTKDQDRSAREFVKRWYEFASGIYLSLGSLDKASLYVQSGLGVSPDNPMLYVYRGAIAELRAAVNATDLRGRATKDTSGPTSRQLESAAADYRRALALDAHFAIARLRLGWVHVRQRDARARDDLDAALNDASDPKTRYLAHLFLGAEAEHDQRLPDAMHEYEAAQRIAPQCQTPYIARAHVAEMLGDVDGAREAASRLANIEKHGDPWWEYQLVGLSLDPLIWLRAAAHQ